VTPQTEGASIQSSPARPAATRLTSTEVAPMEYFAGSAVANKRARTRGQPRSTADNGGQSIELVNASFRWHRAGQINVAVLRVDHQDSYRA
jgi:hypothetical protein